MNIRIGGEGLNLLKEYRVAVTEGIGLGASDIQWLLKLFFQPKDSGIPVWSAVEDKIRRTAGGREWCPCRPQRQIHFLRHVTGNLEKVSGYFLVTEE